MSFYVYSNGRVTLTVIFQYAGYCGYRLENDLVTMLNDSYRRSIHRELSLRESQQGSSPKGHLDRRPDHQLVPRPVRDPGSPLRPSTSVGLCCSLILSKHRLPGKRERIPLQFHCSCTASERFRLMRLHRLSRPCHVPSHRALAAASWSIPRPGRLGGLWRRL